MPRKASKVIFSTQPALQPKHALPWQSTVGLLVSCSGTRTTKLLRLTPSVVRNQQCSIVGNERLLQAIFGGLVNVFLVVGDDCLCNGLANGVDLGCVATTSDADADVDVGFRLLGLTAYYSYDCRSPNLSRPKMRTGSYTLKRRISGWTRERGFPLTLMRPFPA
jgi:hypothetical protein